MAVSKEFIQEVQSAVKDPALANILQRVQALGKNSNPAQWADIFEHLDDETRCLALQSLAAVGIASDTDESIHQ